VPTPTATARIAHTLVALALALFACAGSPARADDPSVEYVVDLSRARSQMVAVEMTLRDIDEPSIDVHFPAWRPGKYVILDLAGSVRGVGARDDAGNPLDIRKISKDTWRVVTRGSDAVTISYRFYANAIRDRTRHADDTHAFLSGSGTFMYWPERRDESLRVRIIAPEGWRIATGLERDPEIDRALVAPSYDVLVDSPIEVGEHHAIDFEVAGKPHEIAIWGRGDFDDAMLIEKFSAIIENQLEIFGELPYERYVFLVHSQPGMGGGTEHLNSTIMGAQPSTFDNEESLTDWLGLVSHEFFHTWNVKQFRPAGIHPYDYQHENYTDLLWVAEGTTSYYDDLTLARAGLIDLDEYLSRISRSIDGYRRLPGRTEQSLSESSFDAWIKFWARDQDFHNHNVSFYRKGSLVSLLLDLRLRKQSDGRVTLDDLMRTMYQRFPLSGPGYTSSDVLAALRELSGSSYSEFFDRYVDGTARLPLETALEWVGLELARDAEPDDGPRPHLGLTLVPDGDFARIRRVDADAPAHAAGIIVDDTIIAMDGVRLEASDLDDRLDRLDPEDTVEFTIMRWDTLRTIEVTLASRPAGRWKITRTDDPTDEQIAAFEQWMHRPWHETEGHDDADEDASPDDG